MDARKPSVFLNGCAVLVLALAAGSCLVLWAHEGQSKPAARVGGGLTDGTVATGEAADLIAVDGDPLDDLGVTKHNVMMVFHSGEVICDDRPVASESNFVRRPCGWRAPVFGSIQDGRRY